MDIMFAGLHRPACFQKVHEARHLLLAPQASHRNGRALEKLATDRSIDRRATEGQLTAESMLISVNYRQLGRPFNSPSCHHHFSNAPATQPRLYSKAFQLSRGQLRSLRGAGSRMTETAPVAFRTHPRIHPKLRRLTPAKPKTINLAHRQWVEVRSWISLMGGTEKVGAWQKGAQIESDCELRMKSLHSCNCTASCFL
jgi:hypothetical protein